MPNDHAHFEHELYDVVFQPLSRSRNRHVQLEGICLYQECSVINPPKKSGAFVLMTPSRVWPRMRGGSPVLHIGSTRHLARQIEIFNNKAWITNREIPRTVAEIMEMQVEGRLEAFLMSHLWLLHLERIPVAMVWYPLPFPEAPEYVWTLINGYMREHGEVPPVTLIDKTYLGVEKIT